jgi:hypothetical protein
MRDECRNCGAKSREGLEWYDDDYCSGKCKKEDGGVIEPEPERNRNAGKVASLEDYLVYWPKNLGQKDRRGQRIKGKRPKAYARVWEPERLNWGPKMTKAQLKQAGFRANREPLPGDWDFVVPVTAEELMAETGVKNEDN